jgi:hypothetical protein
MSPDQRGVMVADSCPGQLRGAVAGQLAGTAHGHGPLPAGTADRDSAGQAAAATGGQSPPTKGGQSQRDAQTRATTEGRSMNRSSPERLGFPNRHGDDTNNHGGPPT